jgi:uncharacterized membrane protein YczE
MQFGRFHGIALITLGVMLLGLQTMLYMTTKQVVTGPREFLTTKLEHEVYPVPGILGIASLMAGAAILAKRRRAEEPEAKNAVK